MHILSPTIFVLPRACFRTFCAIESRRSRTARCIDFALWPLDVSCFVQTRLTSAHIGLIVMWATTATRARFSHTGIFSPPCVASTPRYDREPSAPSHTQCPLAIERTIYASSRLASGVQCDSLHALSRVYTRDAPRRTTHMRIRYKFHETMDTSGQRTGDLSLRGMGRVMRGLLSVAGSPAQRSFGGRCLPTRLSLAEGTGPAST